VAIPISIAGSQFATKKAAKARISELRDSYQDGVIIPDPDSSFLAELLTLHPESDDKIGAGVSHFTVSTDTVFGRTRHFVVHRRDGSSTDFSFHACIDGRKDRRDRLEALRRAIEPSILRFRDQQFASGPMTCPFLSVGLSPSSCHVDHVSPDSFLVLAERWLSTGGLSISCIHITPPQDNQLVAVMTDDTQRAGWVAFHDEHARLRIISPLANLSHAKKS
jgi:Protein of unknown function (DUF3223)